MDSPIIEEENSQFLRSSTGSDESNQDHKGKMYVSKVATYKNPGNQVTTNVSSFKIPEKHSSKASRKK